MRIDQELSILIPLKNPSLSKMRFEKHHQNTLAQNQNPSCAVLERNFFTDFAPSPTFSKTGGFFSGINTKNRPPCDSTPGRRWSGRKRRKLPASAKRRNRNEPKQWKTNGSASVAPASWTAVTESAQSPLSRKPLSRRKEDSSLYSPTSKATTFPWPHRRTAKAHANGDSVVEAGLGAGLHAFTLIELLIVIAIP